MKTLGLLFFTVGIYFSSFSQQKGYYKSEIGAELYAGFSNLGGAFGGEIKYAYLVNKNLAVGQ
jgi:hypothetical protein